MEFRLSDYDFIGFDLDSTIIHYNIPNLVQLEYNVITNFLMDKKGYDPEYFKEPLTDNDLDFLQKGLVFDFERGNVVKLTRKGRVYRASHGTKQLSAEEIQKYYPHYEWDLGEEFVQNPLMIWSRPSLANKIRTLLNCFDMTGGLVFAKLVDSIDKKNGKVLDEYKIWPDILDAFTFMYKREQLKNNEGNFYSEMKANPSRYIHKCSPEVLAWIKSMKKDQKTFLITGSNSDFVELTTGYAFGEDLKSLFDIVICYGQKPGFFTDSRPFYSLKDNYENRIVISEELQEGETYNQGNWDDLDQFFSRITDLVKPRCLYVGDNLLQDIYAPSVHSEWETMVISDEQLAEKLVHHDLSHSHESIINSNAWGSFFSLNTGHGTEDSFWNYIIKMHSKICVPNLEVLCSKPLNELISCFPQEEDDEALVGYYPEKPSTLLNL